MFTVIKKIEISSAHYLDLPYASKCRNLHGHNWTVVVTCKSMDLNDYGMVVDFADIKKNVQDRLDHMYLNTVVDFNPTAENMAKWISTLVPHCVKVEVQESDGNIAIYEKDEAIYEL